MKTRIALLVGALTMAGATACRSNDPMAQGGDFTEGERQNVAGRAPAADASGESQRYTVQRVDEEGKKIMLQPVKTGGGGKVETVTFDDFRSKIAPNQPLEDPADLKEGSQVGIYRDKSNRISKIVIETDDAEGGGGTTR